MDVSIFTNQTDPSLNKSQVQKLHHPMYTEKEFDRIQYPCMIKTHGELDNKWKMFLCDVGFAAYTPNRKELKV